MLRLLSTAIAIALLLSGCTSDRKLPATTTVTVTGTGLTIEVNTASPAEFNRVVGLGPFLAGKIIKARGIKNFDGCNDFVTRVSGIGRLSAKEFSESGLRVNGESC
jgi:DNA uptake protein ComE-like DNA-binding protein